MAEPQLTIKNKSATDDVTLKLADGSSVKIEKGKELALSRVYLLCDDFIKALKEGKLAFTAPADDAEGKLGVEVFRILLGSLGVQLVAAARSMTDGRTALAKQRDAYNTAWTQVLAVIKAGNLLAAGTQNLSDGAALFLTSEAAKLARDKAEKALEDLDAAFIAAGTPTATSLSAYLDARKKLEIELANAQAHFEATEEALAAEFAAIQKAVKDAAATMSSITETGIGSKLTWT